MNTKMKTIKAVLSAIVAIATLGSLNGTAPLGPTPVEMHRVESMYRISPYQEIPLFAPAPGVRDLGGGRQVPAPAPESMRQYISSTKNSLQQIATYLKNQESPDLKNAGDNLEAIAQGLADHVNDYIHAYEQ